MRSLRVCVRLCVWVCISACVCAECVCVCVCECDVCMCVCVFRCMWVPVCLHGKGSLFKVSISYLESTCDKMVDEKKWCEKRERALEKERQRGDERERKRQCETHRD
jgi:hypothetical protein